MPAPLLELSGLRVEYGGRHGSVVAADDVAFDIGRGEIVGLVGESGSGKSTVARAILGLAPIKEGSVRFSGEDVTHIAFKARRAVYRHVQIVFQDPYSSLNPSRRIGRTLAEPLEAHGERDQTSIRDRVHAMLERVHLPADAADRYPSEFSGGQRQRIAIARALILSPQLVICDEAVSALDLSIQAQILDLLRELQADAGLSYLFISHDLEVVRQLCERVVVMYRGRVVEVAPADRLATSPAHPYTHALHEASPLPNPRLQRRKHRTPRRAAASSSPDAGARALDQRCVFAERCPHAVSRCWTERPVVRLVEQGAAVACHRYPEWRRGAAPAAPAETNGSIMRTRTPPPGT
jgi:oligopeptide/dipeptide ABC transporter ATP-binding protein